MDVIWEDCGLFEERKRFKLAHPPSSLVSWDGYDTVARMLEEMKKKHQVCVCMCVYGCIYTFMCEHMHICANCTLINTLIHTHTR
jgi:hypothetical protein